jgi:hypothetical protein
MYSVPGDAKSLNRRGLVGELPNCLSEVRMSHEVVQAFLHGQCVVEVSVGQPFSGWVGEWVCGLVVRVRVSSVWRICADACQSWRSMATGWVTMQCPALHTYTACGHCSQPQTVTKACVRVHSCDVAASVDSCALTWAVGHLLCSPRALSRQRAAVLSLGTVWASVALEQGAVSAHVASENRHERSASGPVRNGVELPTSLKRKRHACHAT